MEPRAIKPSPATTPPSSPAYAHRQKQPEGPGEQQAAPPRQPQPPQQDGEGQAAGEDSKGDEGAAAAAAGQQDEQARGEFAPFAVRSVRGAAMPLCIL